MKIDLTTINDDPVTFDQQVALGSERLDATLVAGEISVALKGIVRPAGDGFMVDGSFAVDGSLSCARCLEPVAWHADEGFFVEYRFAAAAPESDEVALAEDELDVVFLTDGELDLERLAAEQVLLALPMRTVCAEDCAGLCPRCGANLNRQDACSCEPVVDPRWEALRGLTGKDDSN